MLRVLPEQLDDSLRPQRVAERDSLVVDVRVLGRLRGLGWIQGGLADHDLGVPPECFVHGPHHGPGCWLVRAA